MSSISVGIDIGGTFSDVVAFDHNTNQLYSAKVPSTPQNLVTGFERGLEQVHECQTPVFLWVEVEEGKVHIHADVPRESPTVRGFISLLARSLEGAAPDEVARMTGQRLRQKLGAHAHWIQTVRGFGYRFRTEPPAGSE